jgi:hypothetical protein
MSTRLPIMFADDGSTFVLVGIPFLILWVVGGFFAVGLGSWGVLKAAFRRHDPLRIGSFPFLFGVASIAYFLHSDYWGRFGWNVSLFCWLSVLPTVLGLVTILRPVSKTSVAEPDCPANGSQPIRSEKNRTSTAAGSRR